MLTIAGRHEAYFKSKDRQTIHLPGAGSGILLEKDELLNIEWSYKVSDCDMADAEDVKYSHLEALELFKASDLRVIDSFKAPESEYRLWLLERPQVRFITPSNVIFSDLDNIKGLPRWDEWLSLWEFWDQ